MKYSQTPGSTPESVQPRLLEGERIANNVKGLSEDEYTVQSEEVKRQTRGLDLEILKAQREQKKFNLITEHVKIGIAEIGLKTQVQNFRKSTWGLVQATAQASTAQDNALASVEEHGLNQLSIRERLEGMSLSVTEASGKNGAKREVLGARPKYSLGGSAAPNVTTIPTRARNISIE